MELNIKTVKQLISERFDNKLTCFVSEIKTDYSYTNQILNGKKSARSKKVCDAIIEYCKKNNLDYMKYIII